MQEITPGGMPERGTSPESEGVILSTTPITKLQTNVDPEFFRHPTSTTLPSEVTYPPAFTSIPSALEQVKHVDPKMKKLVPVEQATKKSVQDQDEARNFSAPCPKPIFPTDSEKQISELLASTTITSSKGPTAESPVEDKGKDDSGFIFYKCRFCGLTYNYLTTLRAHERVHNIDEPYKCNRCSESFHYMCELEYHAKQHTNLKGYKCECGRTFHSYTDLLYHRHPGDEEDDAVVAPASTVAKSTLRILENEFPVPEFIEKGFEPKHPLKVYSDVRVNPYICQYCSKSYPSSRMLAYHMYGHRGEKIFNPRASRYLMARTENSYISPGF
uniref:Zinc finger protein unc-98 n=1 Tax=Setaria digitata TaxID=48799 RepID=A0A915Q401_9BILA